MTLTNRHRQFYATSPIGNWVKAISLPDRPGVIAKQLENGGIEERGIRGDRSYRMTDNGLAAKTAPVRI
jgi:hypothetical protein